MNQQQQKYPKRSDTLALFKARERAATAPAAANAAAGRPVDTLLCMGMCAPR